MEWFFNNIYYISFGIVCAEIVFTVWANSIDTKKHGNWETNIRVAQLLLFFTILYLIILILGHLLLISLPVYIQFSHLPATVQGALTNMTGKAHLTTIHTVMSQVNTLALLIVIEIISAIDLKQRIKLV